MAIALVLVQHAWYHFIPLRPDPAAAPPHSVIDFTLSRTFEGVSLFLVLSGFCLSYPLLKRRQAGVEHWFVPSEFLARRILRILPTYYAALALFAPAAYVLADAHHAVASIGSRPDRGNLATHALLVHNMTGYESAINASYWSLGLEWQWYWLFPVLLVACAEVSPVVLLGCLGVGTAWLLEAHGTMLAGAALPGRLFEFCISRSMRERILPRLTRAVAWADRLYPHGRARPAPRGAYPAPSPLDGNI